MNKCITQQARVHINARGLLFALHASYLLTCMKLKTSYSCPMGSQDQCTPLKKRIVFHILIFVSVLSVYNTLALPPSLTPGDALVCKRPVI